ncbi:hypothetical protein FGG08_002485 [Glutinoglossum americanum]|uniref:Uncharacterized protein n=1 Tax=Glutinoglossum americanum TaxID=1670608 RepID=A0A9P8I009_9PEZI|nr:hypothetical protein FGG08_002485 [Glutinoglossum americanum]
MPCTIAGDSDLYGLGIRLGLYLQCASGILLRHLSSHSTINRVRTTNNVLSSAIALTTMVNTLRGTALSVDYLMTYYLTVVLFYAESYNLEVKHLPGRVDEARMDEYGDGGHIGRALVLHPDVPLVFQNVLFTVYTLFGAWFWHRGLFSIAPTTSCGPERAALIFLFPLRNIGWEKFATAFAIIIGLVFALITLIHLCSLKEGISSGPVLTVAEWLVPLSGPGSEFELKEAMASYLKPKAPGIKGRSVGAVARAGLHYTCIYLFGPIIGITSVERMITANNISTTGILHSSGQLLALFIGGSSFCMAIWEFLLRRGQGEEKVDMEKGGDGAGRRRKNVGVACDIPQGKAPEVMEREIEQLRGGQIVGPHHEWVVRGRTQFPHLEEQERNGSGTDDGRSHGWVCGEPDNRYCDRGTAEMEGEIGRRRYSF